MVHSVYAVIGEHKTEPDQLLIMDADGQCYAWLLSTDETQPIQPDDTWRWDVSPPTEQGGEPSLVLE